MYTGLKGEDCLMDGRVHTMEKKQGRNSNCLLDFD